MKLKSNVLGVKRDGSVRAFTPKFGYKYQSINIFCLRGVNFIFVQDFSFSFLELYLFAGGSKLRTFYHPPIRLTFSVRRKSGPRWLAMGKEAARIIDKRKGIKSDPVVPWAPH